MADVQKENGYTPIANEIMDALIRAGLQASELCVVLFILRKTYGWNKKSDQISLSQFCESLPYSKQTIVTSLKRLQLVKVIRLVQSGNSKVLANEYAFNKDFETWQLVKLARLVKSTNSTSQVWHKQLVKPALHTKDNNTKDKYKRHIVTPSAEEIILLRLKIKGSLKKKQRTKLEPSRDAMDLSKLLLDCILVNNPQHSYTETTIPRWAEDIDKIMRIDKYTYQQIETVIMWAQHDQFWHANILSGAKLRKQFNHLVMKARSNFRQNGDNVVII